MPPLQRVPMLVCLLIELKNAVASGGRVFTASGPLRLWHSVHGKNNGRTDTGYSTLAKSQHFAPHGSFQFTQ
jgi:hypothetical protein